MAACGAPCGCHLKSRLPTYPGVATCLQTDSQLNIQTAETAKPDLSWARKLLGVAQYPMRSTAEQACATR